MAVLACCSYGVTRLLRASPRLLWLIVIPAWCLTAWQQGRKSALALSTEGTADFTREETRAALLEMLDELTRGRNGIHLQELHAHLTQHPSLADLPRAALAPWLRDYGVPVTRSLSVDGVEGRSGVRRADIEALIGSPTPPSETVNSRVAETNADLR